MTKTVTLTVTLTFVPTELTTNHSTRPHSNVIKGLKTQTVNVLEQIAIATPDPIVTDSPCATSSSITGNVIINILEYRPKYLVTQEGVPTPQDQRPFKG